MLRRPRIIPRLDVKGPNVVKGIHLEGLRVVGSPATLARRYAEDADELLYIDIVASLYGRNQLTELLLETTNDVFIPITVGGGIASLADIKRVLDAGADKVAINTAAIRNPRLLREASDHYGAQCIVLNIEAKRMVGTWEALTDCGRERSGKDAVAWARECGPYCGEILATSIDQEGTRRGYDTALIEAIAREVPCPVVACGGMGSIEDARAAYAAGACLGMASVLHYGQLTIQEIRDGITNQGEFHAGQAGREGRSEARPGG
jgi:cyclase